MWRPRNIHSIWQDEDKFGLSSTECPSFRSAGSKSSRVVLQVRSLSTSPNQMLLAFAEDTEGEDL